MNTIPFIENALTTGRNTVLNLLNDLKEEQLAQPTINGGNHALWVLGHLLYTESLVINNIMLGNPDPLPQLACLFSYGSTPSQNASDYPAFSELLGKYDEVRNQTMNILKTMTDESLDQPAAACPPDMRGWFGTIGRCFTTQILHPTMHYGQLADIRKSLGKPPLMA